MNCRFSTGTNSHPCLAAVLGINRQSSWDCSGNFGIKCPRGAGAGPGVLSSRQDELCCVGCRPCIPKAVTRDMWSSGLQHPSSRSRSVHSCAASHALERSQARGCFSKHVIPRRSPTSEGCGVSLSFRGKLGCHFGFRRAIKAQFFIFIQPASSALSTSGKPLELFHIGGALRR